MNISVYTVNQRNGLIVNPALSEGINMNCSGYKKDPLCEDFDNHVLRCEDGKIIAIFYLNILGTDQPELMDIGFVEEFL